MYASDRGGGLAARSLPDDRRPKYPPPPTHRTRRIDWARYRRFLRRGWALLFARLRRVVGALPPPYRVRPPGTPGRPPTDPREVVRCLLLRALEGWSFDETHATLAASADLRRSLGIHRLPAAPTVAALARRVPPSYLQRLIVTLARPSAHAPLCLAGDGTGISIRQFESWLAAKVRSGVRHRFVKLHALVSTRARFPVFWAAHVTDAFTNDITELPALLDQVPRGVPLGTVILDRGYQSKQNAQRIADRGARPVIALRDNVRVTTEAEGYPAWKAMVRDQRTDPGPFRRRYRRRAVVEGVFGAFKHRFGGTIRTRRADAQRVEILARVVVWNAVALSYDTS